MKKLYVLFLLAVLLLTPNVAFAQQQTNSNMVNTKVGNPKTAPGTTAPPPPSDIKQGIIDKFGITMNGFDQDHLQWAWEELWEAGGGFTDHLRGTTILAGGSSGISYQSGCFGGEVSLHLGQYQPEDFFKFIILHELGHVFEACNPRSVTHQVEQENAYASEGGISFYAKNATICFTDGSVSNYHEDYADMLAYYVDRTAGFASAPKSCGGPPNPPNPYSNNGFPIHLSVAQSILQ